MMPSARVLLLLAAALAVQGGNPGDMRDAPLQWEEPPSSRASQVRPFGSV
jgi:hypothetical protein